MSKASRLRAADTRITATAPQLGLNSANIPGGVGSVDIPTAVAVAGYLWDSRDGRWDCGAPIGAALALEIAEKGSS